MNTTPKQRPERVTIARLPVREAQFERKDGVTAYQVAVNLYMQENQVTWARFNIMLAANSIIVAAIGFAAGTSRLLLLAAALLSSASAYASCGRR